ncbi:MAG: hypothetical protein H8E94_09560 [Alphaproteobacteria bacterium]|nr:hypothetical protein [Alphaproteobacteria bacterium]
MAEDIEKIVEAFSDDLRENVRKMVASLKGASRTPLNILENAGRIQNIFDFTQEKMSEMFPPAEPIACQQGCTFCCHLLFFTDALTVFIVADRLKENCSPEQLHALRSRLTDFIDNEYGVTQVPRPPCPVLADGLCMAYDVRPLVCRAQNSLQVSQCEEKHQGKLDMVVAHDIPLRVWTVMSEGIAAGLAEAGLAGNESLEFVTALRIVLDNPAAMDQWIAGEPVFEPAQWTDSDGPPGPLH